MKFLLDQSCSWSHVKFSLIILAQNWTWTRGKFSKYSSLRHGGDFLWDSPKCLNQEISEDGGEKKSSPDGSSQHLGELHVMLPPSFNYREGVRWGQDGLIPAVGNNGTAYYRWLKTLHTDLLLFLLTMLKQGLSTGCETCQPPPETLLESIDNLNVHERSSLEPIYFKYSTSLVFKGGFCS